jgi:pyridoxal phosphate enzyme (YggS family)
VDYQTFLARVEELTLSCNRALDSVRVLVATKYHTPEALEALYQAGGRLFGESRVQQMVERQGSLPSDIEWHFIGSLQRKKVKQVIGKTSLIHSVDTPPLAEEISKRSATANITTRVLLQVNTSEEKSKHGFTPEECEKNIATLDAFPNMEICGLMTMAPNTKDSTVVRQCFRSLAQLRNKCEALLNRKLPELSMGMSNDYPIAIEEGSTLLRIGSLLSQ